MKGIVIFFAGLLAFFVFIGITSGGDCSDAQVILKLSAGPNAHGSLWNSSIGTRVCYSDYFSPEYNGTNPHECNSNDVVLKLSGINNAHAADKSSGIYPISVCHKGLSECEISTSGCTNGKTPVFYVSGTTNAHLSNSPIVGYATVCCNGAGSPRPAPLPPTRCYGLSKNTCETDDTIAMLDEGCNAFDKSACRCTWNEAQSRCTLEWSFTAQSAPNCDYKCIVEASEQTECSGGSQILGLSARSILVSADPNCPLSIPVEESKCRSGSATVPCGNLEANLPFFGFWNFVASLAAVAMIYALLNREDCS